MVRANAGSLVTAFCLGQVRHGLARTRAEPQILFSKISFRPFLRPIHICLYTYIYCLGFVNSQSILVFAFWPVADVQLTASGSARPCSCPVSPWSARRNRRWTGTILGFQGGKTRTCENEKKTKQKGTYHGDGGKTLSRDLFINRLSSAVKGGEAGEDGLTTIANIHRSVGCCRVKMKPISDDVEKKQGGGQMKFRVSTVNKKKKKKHL